MPATSSTPPIVDIPLAKILPNPENPRGPVPPEAAQTMAESLKEAGQKTEIRVRPLSEAERQAHPGYEYLLIGGHVRLAGAKLAGLESLRAVVVEPKDPNEEAFDALLDNRWEEMSWWRWDLAIEARIKADPDLSQRQLAARLGFSAAKVNNARKITQFLTPAARDLVGQSVQPLNTQNKGFLITESILLVLSDLGDPQKVEEALRRVLDDQMTEGQVRQMVAGLKPKPSPQAGEGRVRGSVQPTSVMNPSPVQAQSPEESAVQVAQPNQTALQKLYFVLTAGALGGFLLANLKRALGMLTRRYMLHGLAAAGVLVLVGGHWAKSLFQGSSKAPVTESAAPAERPEPPTGAEQAPAQPPVPSARSQAVPASTAPKPARARKELRRPAAAAPVPAAPVQGAVPAWAPEAYPLIKDVGEHFYGRSGQNWGSDLGYFKDLLTADYYPVFEKQYFPADQRTELQVKQQAQVYSGDGPRAIGGQGGAVLFRVQGHITFQDLSSRSPKNLWTKPVALEFAVRHLEGLGYKVEKVIEIEPEPSQKTGNKDDAVGKTIKDVAGGVTDVANGVAKVSEVKKALGL